MGVAHHYGWAIAVVATPDGDVVDRRRIELIEPGLPTAPIHHEGGAHELHRTGPLLDDDELAALVERVRASVRRATTRSLDELAASVPGQIASVSVRDWVATMPEDIATLRRAPHESRADSVMYCQAVAEESERRGWKVHRYDAKSVERDAAAALGARADDVLHGARSRLGAPWTKDHRIALAATILAA